MKALVLGGGGWLGQRLVDRLGARAICVDVVGHYRRARE